jgi:hypothetical protein
VNSSYEPAVERDGMWAYQVECPDDVDVYTSPFVYRTRDEALGQRNCELLSSQVESIDPDTTPWDSK